MKWRNIFFYFSRTFFSIEKSFLKSICVCICLFFCVRVAEWRQRHRRRCHRCRFSVRFENATWFVDKLPFARPLFNCECHWHRLFAFPFVIASLVSKWSTFCVVSNCDFLARWDDRREAAAYIDISDHETLFLSMWRKANVSWTNVMCAHWIDKIADDRFWIANNNYTWIFNALNFFIFDWGDLRDAFHTNTRG